MRSLLLLTLVCVVAACGGGGGPTFADDHPRIYLERNRERLAAALDAQTGPAQRFVEMVDYQRESNDVFAFEGWYAGLVSQLSGDTSYCDYAVDYVDAYVRSEEDLIRNGSAPQAAGDSYLEVGPRVGDVMLTYDWCFEQTSTNQRTRWLDFAAQAVWNVWNPEEAKWGNTSMPWSGWATDQPSNNYYYSFLRATMLFGLAAHGEHPDAQQWLDFFRDTKIGGEAVPEYDEQLVGGGSREGTGYGVSMHRLWELYDLWQGSTDESLADLTPHTRASMLYYLHAIVPTRDYVAPIGDHARDSTAALFDYERNYLQELSHLYHDDALVPAVRTLLDGSSVPEMSTRTMIPYDFLYDISDVTPGAMPAGRAWYGPGIGEVFARSSWDSDATWVSLIAGPYSQSHAHRDQGSFMIYKEGWLAYDPIVDSTSGIRQEEELHNLVRIDGASQQAETEARVLAVHHGDGWLHVAADLAPVYGGAVELDQRELVYLEPDVVVIFDRITSDGDQIWQMSAPVQPSVSGARATVEGGSHSLRVDRIAPASGATTTVASWSDDGDFTGGYRLDTTVAGGARKMLHVLSLDGSVTTAVAADADGRTGVTITFAGGGTATVRFGATGVDGTLDVVNGPSGDIAVSLDEGVDPLPE